MSYLDKNGLTYLWGKIKAALGGKGDSLTLNNQTLSLKAGEKVLSSVTLPSGGSGSSGGGEVIYSTEERVIGRWIDGRPLYQKTFDLKDIYISNEGVDTLVVLPTDCDIKRWDGYIKSFDKFPLCYNKTRIDLGCQMADLDYLLTYSTENYLYVESGRYTSFSNAEAIVIVEYTKTTDQPGS